jgi:hypothetical protein
MFPANLLHAAGHVADGVLAAGNVHVIFSHL